MIAGTWVLLLLPLMQILKAWGWAASMPVPTLFDSPGTVTLDDTLLAYGGVFEPVVFCIGVALLFARERDRRPGRLDWTRRWGVGCSYVVLLLSATQVLYMIAFVLVGISAMLLAMPLAAQPRATKTLVDLSVAYVLHGPQPTLASGAVRVAFSSAAILLACVPLFDALRSSGPKREAAVLVAPLALFALLYLAQVGWYLLKLGVVGSAASGGIGTVGFGSWGGLRSPSFSGMADPFYLGVYFCPELPVARVAALPDASAAASSGTGAVLVEVAKWCVVLAIAVRLTLAHLGARRRARKTGPG
jgi:hypothetical protein